MINNLVLPAISEHDVRQLQYVTFYWQKDLNKLIKRANKWTHRFRGTNDVFQITPVYHTYQMVILFEQVNNYRNFLQQRYTLIKSNVKLVKKFSPFIGSYMALHGMCAHIYTIIEYYNTLEKRDVASKRALATELTSAFCERWFKAFQTSVMSAIASDQYLQIKFNDVLILPEKLPNFSTIIQEVMTYAKLLERKKKITDTQFVSVAIETVEFNAFINTYLYELSSFIAKLY